MLAEPTTTSAGEKKHLLSTHLVGWQFCHNFLDLVLSIYLFKLGMDELFHGVDPVVDPAGILEVLKFVSRV